MICIGLLCLSLVLESRALYSPATIPGCTETLFVGGWRTDADIGPDRIYRMNLVTGALHALWSVPRGWPDDAWIVHVGVDPGVGQS